MKDSITELPHRTHARVGRLDLLSLTTAVPMTEAVQVVKAAEVRRQGSTTSAFTCSARYCSVDMLWCAGLNAWMLLH